MESGPLIPETPTPPSPELRPGTPDGQETLTALPAATINNILAEALSGDTGDIYAELEALSQVATSLATNADSARSSVKQSPYFNPRGENHLGWRKQVEWTGRVWLEKYLPPEKLREFHTDQAKMSAAVFNTECLFQVLIGTAQSIRIVRRKMASSSVTESSLHEIAARAFLFAEPLDGIRTGTRVPINPKLLGNPRRASQIDAINTSLPANQQQLLRQIVHEMHGSVTGQRKQDRQSPERQPQSSKRKNASAGKLPPAFAENLVRQLRRTPTLAPVLSLLLVTAIVLSGCGGDTKPQKPGLTAEQGVRAMQKTIEKLAPALLRQYSTTPETPLASPQEAPKTEMPSQPISEVNTQHQTATPPPLGQNVSPQEMTAEEFIEYSEQQGARLQREHAQAAIDTEATAQARAVEGGKWLSATVLSENDANKRDAVIRWLFEIQKTKPSDNSFTMYTDDSNSVASQLDFFTYNGYFRDNPPFDPYDIWTEVKNPDTGQSIGVQIRPLLQLDGAANTGLLVVDIGTLDQQAREARLQSYTLKTRLIVDPVSGRVVTRFDGYDEDALHSSKWAGSVIVTNIHRTVAQEQEIGATHSALGALVVTDMNGDTETITYDIRYQDGSTKKGDATFTAVNSAGSVFLINETPIPGTNLVKLESIAVRQLDGTRIVSDLEPQTGRNITTLPAGSLGAIVLVDSSDRPLDVRDTTTPWKVAFVDNQGRSRPLGEVFPRSSTLGASGAIVENETSGGLISNDLAVSPNGAYLLIQIITDAAEVQSSKTDSSSAHSGLDSWLVVIDTETGEQIARPLNSPQARLDYYTGGVGKADRLNQKTPRHVLILDRFVNPVQGSLRIQNNSVITGLDYGTDCLVQKETRNWPKSLPESVIGAQKRMGGYRRWNMDPRTGYLVIYDVIDPVRGTLSDTPRVLYAGD